MVTSNNHGECKIIDITACFLGSISAPVPDTIPFPTQSYPILSYPMAPAPAHAYIRNVNVKVRVKVFFSHLVIYECEIFEIEFIKSMDDGEESGLLGEREKGILQSWEGG